MLLDMVLSTKTYKKSSNKRKGNKIKLDRVIVSDTLEDWLNSPEDFERCTQAKNCEHECNKILIHTYPRRIVRIASFSNLVGVDYQEYKKLCGLCQECYYQWFYDSCWFDHPERKTSKEVWQLEVLENNLKDSYETARTKYDTMLRDYRYNLAKLNKEEIESQKRFVDHNFEFWQNSLLQLREAIDREDAIQKGYEV